MDISVAEAHNRLSYLLKQVRRSPVTITRRGKAVGVIISPEEYEKLRKVAAFIELVEISREVREGPGAEEIYRLSRQELEGRA